MRIRLPPIPGVEEAQPNAIMRALLRTTNDQSP